MEHNVTLTTEQIHVLLRGLKREQYALLDQIANSDYKAEVRAEAGKKHEETIDVYSMLLDIVEPE